MKVIKIMEQWNKNERNKKQTHTTGDFILGYKTIYYKFTGLEILWKCSFTTTDSNNKSITESLPEILQTPEKTLVNNPWAKRKSPWK